MKELRITQVNGGYIVAAAVENAPAVVSVAENFGAVVKGARVYFDETIVKGKKESDDKVETAE